MTYEREVLSGRPAILDKEPAPLAGAKDEAVPFSFIRERDIPCLAFLLKDKTAQDIAIVINYLDPAIGMRLLELFPKDKQVEVALILGQEEINMEKVHALEEMVKSRLTYVVGGENKLITLLDMTNEDVRDKIVKTLETRDAQTATRLKSEDQEPGIDHSGTACSRHSDPVPEHRCHAVRPDPEGVTGRHPAEGHLFAQRRRRRTAQAGNGAEPTSLRRAPPEGKTEPDGPGAAADQRRSCGG